MTAAQAYQSGPDEAAEIERRLLEQLPQVHLIARRIHDRLPRHVALDDLVQAGVVGLMDAVRKYDASKNVPLPAYAKFRIRGAILDSLRALDWSPRELRRKARDIEEAHARLHAALGRAASDEEVAAELRMELEQFQQLLGELRGLELGSFEAQFPGEESGAYLPNAPEQDPYFVCLRSELKRELAQAIEELPDRERQLMALYYFEELTMKEIGAVLGIGESRVCQIHASVLIRLRARLRAMSPERRPAAATAAPEERHARPAQPTRD